MDGKTCNKVRIVEVLGVACPSCRKPPGKKQRCQFKAGDWPPDDSDDDEVMEEAPAQHVLSPRRAGANAANATTGKRISRAVERFTGTPSKFRDHRKDWRSRSRTRPKKDEECLGLTVVEDAAASLGLEDERVELLKRLARAVASLDAGSTETSLSPRTLPGRAVVDSELRMAAARHFVWPRNFSSSAPASRNPNPHRFQPFWGLPTPEIGRKHHHGPRLY